MGDFARGLAAVVATHDFRSAIAVPQSLLDVHDEERSGRRRSVAREMALNRAVVVLTVAAWQAWVEKYARNLLEWSLKTAKNIDDADWRIRELSHAHEAIRPLVEREIGRFSTPSSGAVCNLLGILGVNPRERWTFSLGNRKLRPNQVAERLDAWVKVRHAIAHGDSRLPSLDVLAKTKGGHGSLTRPKAEQCIRFFDRLVIATGDYDYRRH